MIQEMILVKVTGLTNDFYLLKECKKKEISWEKEG